MAIVKPAQAQFADSTSEPSQSSQDQPQSNAIPRQRAGTFERVNLDDRHGINPSKVLSAATDSVVSNGTMTIAQFVPASEPYPVPPTVPSVAL